MMANKTLAKSILYSLKYMLTVIGKQKCNIKINPKCEHVECHKFTSIYFLLPLRLDWLDAWARLASLVLRLGSLCPPIPFGWPLPVFVCTPVGKESFELREAFDWLPPGGNERSRPRRRAMLAERPRICWLWYAAIVKWKIRSIGTMMAHKDDLIFHGIQTLLPWFFIFCLDMSKMYKQLLPLDAFISALSAFCKPLSIWWCAV